LTLLRFLTLQVQGSDYGRRTLGQLRERLFERGEPTPQALEAALALLATTDLRRSLHEVEAPALVVAGTRDTLVPLAATQALAAALPRATLAAITGAAHAPFLSHPAPFLDALARVRRWLSRNFRRPIRVTSIRRPCAGDSDARSRRTTRRPRCSEKSAPGWRSDSIT
jgi:pimeloyl-ACP methyl ester carboxylesterase